MFHHWYLWLTGLSLIPLIALAILAPSVLPLVGTFLQPIVKPVGDALGWLLAKLFGILEQGIEDILDTWQTLVTVVILAICLTWYLHPDTVSSCKQVIQDLHTHFKFIPRTGAVSYHLPFWASWL